MHRQKRAAGCWLRRTQEFVGYWVSDEQRRLQDTRSSEKKKNSVSRKPGICLRRNLKAGLESGSCLDLLVNVTKEH